MDIFSILIVVFFLLYLIFKFLPFVLGKKVVSRIIYGENNTYIDDKGYLRYKGSNYLVHRDVAYEEIYRLNTEEEYPLPFREYQVHHIDGNKLNNDYNNLEILTRDEHMEKHNLK